MKALETPSANISSAQRFLPVSFSSSMPTRMISPRLKVCARPRNAIAAMHQEAKSSPAGMFSPKPRPTDMNIMMPKISTRNTPAA
jgi:hypothetical protein